MVYVDGILFVHIIYIVKLYIGSSIIVIKYRLLASG